MTQITSTKSLLFVIPTYNRKELLDRAIASIHDSSEVGWLVHILVVNDGSNDGTDKYLRQFDKSSSIFFIDMTQNSGVNKARQAGIAWALEKGYQWLSFLDDDDRITPDCIEGFVSSLTLEASSCWIALPSINDKGESLCEFREAGRNNYLVDYMGRRIIRGDFQHFVKAESVAGLSFLDAFKNGEEWYFWCNLSHRCSMYIGQKKGVVKEYLPGGLSQGFFNRDKKYLVAKYKALTLGSIMPKKWYAKILYNYCRMAYKKKVYLKAYSLAKKTIKANPLLLRIYPYYLFSMIRILFG